MVEVRKNIAVQLLEEQLHARNRQSAIIPYSLPQALINRMKTSNIAILWIRQAYSDGTNYSYISTGFRLLLIKAPIDTHTSRPERTAGIEACIIQLIRHVSYSPSNPGIHSSYFMTYQNRNLLFFKTQASRPLASKRPSPPTSSPDPRSDASGPEYHSHL